MTNEEAKRFVSEVLQGLWPRWQPKEEEVRGLTERLRPYDYEKSRTIVNNVFFASESRGIDPPAGKILKALRCSRQCLAEQRRAVKLYTLVKEELFNKGKRMGIKFFGDDNKDSNEIEKEAEYMRGKCNALYGCNHIVIRHWET